MSLRRLQRGMGMGGMMVLIALAAFFVTLIVKLGPAYASFWTVTSIMQDVAAEPSLAEEGRNAILQRIGNLLYVNQVSAVDSKAFAVEKVGSTEFDVKVDYEIREHLFFNVDAVLSFAHEVTVRGQ